MTSSQHGSEHLVNPVRLPLRLEPQPEGGWVITSPLVPELITEADTMAEVLPNTLDAWQVVLEIYEDEGRALPAELYSMDASTEPVMIDILLPA